MRSSGWARLERAGLCEEFDELGPDAATLCGGWTTRDLAAHLVVRESRPDASLGIVLKPMHAWTERVQREAAQRPWPELIAAVRNGPPVLSAFRLPGSESLFNLSEFFVHHEDVRRAQDGWAARDLDPEFADALWENLRRRAIPLFRRARVGVQLRRTDGRGGQCLAHPGSPQAVVSGPAAELMLYAFGRTGHALVSIEGDPAARAALSGTDLSL